MQSESEVTVQHSKIMSSFASAKGGCLYMSKDCYMDGIDIVIEKGQSKLGGAIYIDDLSEVSIEKFNIFGNIAQESGGAVYCQQGHIHLSLGNLSNNNAKLYGGGIYGKTCQVTVDQIRVIDNRCSSYGGGIYASTSAVDIHNSEAIHNTAGHEGNFALMTWNTIFRSYLDLIICTYLKP